MPTTRKLTPDELQHLSDQGQDVTGMDQQQFDIYSPQEQQQMQAKREAEQAGAIQGGVVPTLKSHAGSLVGGGLAGTAGWGAAALLAPETGAMSLLVPAGAAAITSLIGSKAGDVLQHKVVEPTIGMSPQQIMDEQSKAETARQVYPKTSMATDVVGGMLVGGGSPSLRAPAYAAKGLMRGLAEEGLDPRMLNGGGNPIYKSAIQNVVTGGALNTAINAATQLAQTGKVDPTELGVSAIAGTFMSEPSALGRKLNPQWKPLERVQPETPSVAEGIEPDGTSIADVEAYKKIAGKQTAEVQQQNQDYITKRDAIAQMQESQYQREVAEQQQAQQTAEQWRQANWRTTAEDGTPSIADSLVQKEYIRRNKVNTKKVQLPEQRALAIQQNERLGDVPVDQMRQELYDQDAPQRDPVGYQQEQAQKQQEQAQQVQRMAEIQQAQRDQAARQQQIEAEAQQRQQDFPNARQEQQTQQIQEANAQRPPTPQASPLTENQRRIINVEGLRQQMAGGGLSEPREGGTLFQEADSGQPTGGMSTAEHDRLLAEAGKAATGVGMVEGDGLRTPTGQLARGASYDPQEVGRRLIGLAREHATSDTGYHELVHTMLRDLDRSPDPYHQQLAENIRKSFGGEESAAESIGKEYHKTVEDAATASLPGKIGRYFKDVWAATKVNTGEGSAGDYQANLIRRMRQRSGEQDVTVAGQGRGGQVGTQYQPTFPDDESRFKLTQSAIGRIRSDHPDLPEAKNLADRFHKTYTEAQELQGKWWNPVAQAAKKMSPEDIRMVDKALYKDVSTKTFNRNKLQTPEQKKVYDAARKALDDDFQHRKNIGEPVYDRGVPRPSQQDPFYFPTTIDSKVANILRQNVDRPAIQKLSDDYIQNQLAHGVPKDVAQQNLKDDINSLRGNIKSSGGTSSDIQYNANRKAQGIPLPDSWRRQDLLKNLQVYFRRSAHDAAYYHNVETDTKAMAALGYQKDPWNNPIHEPDVENMNGNDAVRHVTEELKGERLGQFERNAHAVESLATVGMLGTPTEVHKTFSSLFKTVGEYADNPIESTRILMKGLEGVKDAWFNNFQKIHDTGYHLEDSKRASDFLNTNMTMGERLGGLAKAVRSIYTVGGLTEKFTKAYLHAVGEYMVPTKIAAAEQGNTQAVRLLKSLDPDYVVGKRYVGNELQTMASEFANQIHGTKDARTLPPVMLHDNEISAFLKLTSWNIAQTNNFMRNVWMPMKEGNLKPLVMSLFSSAIGGLVIKGLRETVNGKASSAIPSLGELQEVEDEHGNKIGLMGNKKLTTYNLMAASSFAGFGGLLSLAAKYPFDIAYKNNLQGMTFPLDEAVSNVGSTVKNAIEALSNDPNANIVDISTHAIKDLFVNNVQLARMGFNHLANSGAAPKSWEYQKELSDKLGQQRRWKMAAGLPYEAQGESEGDPYMNLSQKEFKREQDLGKAVQEVGPLVQNIIKTYGNNPEVMFEKLKGLKQNSYATMPSLEDTPMAFMRYVRFLKNSQGDQKASEMVQDYLKHKMVNEVKSSMVP